MKKISLILSLILLVFSCNQKSKNAKQEIIIPSSVWDKSFEVKYSFQHNDTSKLASVTADFYTTKTYNFSKLIFYCKIISPSGSIREKNYTLDVKDNNGDRLGVHEKNFFKLSVDLISKNRLQEQGEYQIIIRQDMPMDNLSGVEKICLSYSETSR